jgi:hypothetical protein
MKNYLVILALFLFATNAAQAANEAFSIINSARVDIITRQFDSSSAIDIISSANYSIEKKLGAKIYKTPIKDLNSLLNVALTYRFTADEDYLQAVEKALNAWLKSYTLTFNPANETKLDKLLMAFDITKDSLHQETINSMNRFLKNMGSGYLDTINYTKRDGKINNMQSQRVKLLTLAAYSINNSQLIEAAHDAFSEQLETNIYDNKSAANFSRSNALDYATNDLEPLLFAAIAASEHGENWFEEKNAAGASLSSALRWIADSMEENSTSNQEIKNYFASLDSSHSFYLFSLAAFFDPFLREIADDLAEQNVGVENEWLEVVFPN